MRATRSYTDLKQYEKCPRLLAFSLEYEPLEQPEAINTGLFTHDAIFAFFRGTDWREAISKAKVEALVRANRIEDEAKHREADKRIIASADRAYQLSARYIEKWAGDYTAPIIEPELRLGNVVAHPDLIAFLKIGETEFRTIVDFKTTKSPDMRWYDISGQVDLYAYILKEAYDDCIGLIAYDIISEEGIFRHTRPPQLKRGSVIYNMIAKLTEIAIDDSPHFQYDCPNKCAFWEACLLAEQDGNEACREYLDKYYIRRED